MATKAMYALLASGALLGASSTVTAQRWGHGPMPRFGACFYQDADFRGEYFCVGPGEDVDSVPDDMNDKISSIRTFGRAEVTVFKDSRFRGGSTRFDSSVRNLEHEGWNDRISSIRVQGTDPKGFGNRDRPFVRSGDADRTVRRAYQDLLHRDPDSEGLRQYRSRIIDDGWTEEQVRDDLRKSPEFRERTTMTRAKAQEIVRRAYLAVLKRQPDQGAEGYINNVMRDNWSQQDVERELRNSPEFRNR